MGVPPTRGQHMQLMNLNNGVVRVLVRMTNVPVGKALTIPRRVWMLNMADMHKPPVRYRQICFKFCKFVQICMKFVANMMKCPHRTIYGYIYRSKITFTTNLARFNVKISSNSHKLVLNVTNVVVKMIILGYMWPYTFERIFLHIHCS